MKVKVKQPKKVNVCVKVNGRMFTNYLLSTDNMEIGNPEAIEAYINRKQGNDQLKEIVNEALQAITVEVVQYMIWSKANFDKILDDAFALATNDKTLDDIAHLTIYLNQFLPKVYDVTSNFISKKVAKEFEGYKTYDQILTVLLATIFLDDGIITFDANIEK